MEDKRIHFEDFLKDATKDTNGPDIPSLEESHSKCVMLLSLFFDDSMRIHKETDSETIKLTLKIMGDAVFNAFCAMTEKVITDIETLQEAFENDELADQVGAMFVKSKFNEIKKEMEKH